MRFLTFLTLDGVMQGPGGPEEDPSGGFTHGGWARSCWDDVMEQVMGEAMAAPYDLLLGRKTYEIFAAYWPDAGNDPPANKFNNATKVRCDIHLEQTRVGKLRAHHRGHCGGGLSTQGPRRSLVTSSWQLATDPDPPFPWAYR